MKTAVPIIVWITLSFAMSGTTGCKKTDPHAGHSHNGHSHDGHSHDAPGDPKETEAEKEDGHGDELALGNLTVASREFAVSRFGDVVPGQESAFQVTGVGIEEAELATLNIYLWVEDAEGNQLSAPAKGEREGGGLHFHVMPREGKGTPHRVVLRLRVGDVDERAGLPLDGHGHDHQDGPHHGMLASFKGSAGSTGFLELKLHNDRGDLELWLALDDHVSKPFDLSLDAEIEVEFVDVSGRKVMLRPRNRDENEDEDGQANVRDGMTNYFIYPSRDGEDASWLQGKDFYSIVMVRFAKGDEKIASEEFVLKPHVH